MEMYILTGCSRTDIQIIKALLSYERLTPYLRLLIRNLDNSIISSAEYDVLDEKCAVSYINGEYRDYLKRVNQNLDTQYPMNYKEFEKEVFGFNLSCG